MEREPVFQVGDTVIIKHLENITIGMPFGINPSMYELGGVAAMVSKIEHGRYHFESFSSGKYDPAYDGCRYYLTPTVEDEELSRQLEHWSWSAPMLEKVAPKVLDRPYKLTLTKAASSWHQYDPMQLASLDHKLYSGTTSDSKSFTLKVKTKTIHFNFKN